MLKWTINSDYKTTLSAQSEAAIASYQKTLASPEIGFFRLPENRELLNETKKVFERFQHKKYFVHIGIGGSALGPEMILSALGNNSGVEFIFINNIQRALFKISNNRWTMRSNKKLYIRQQVL